MPPPSTPLSAPDAPTTSLSTRTKTPTTISPPYTHTDRLCNADAPSTPTSEITMPHDTPTRSTTPANAASPATPPPSSTPQIPHSKQTATTKHRIPIRVVYTGEKNATKTASSNNRPTHMPPSASIDPEPQTEPASPACPKNSVVVIPAHIFTPSHTIPANTKGIFSIQTRIPPRRNTTTSAATNTTTYPSPVPYDKQRKNIRHQRNH